MSLFVDEKFLNGIGHLLRNFKKKQNYLWNFSCPICGDSRKKKIRARGYIYRYQNKLKFKCHNCGCTMSFGDFLKQLDATTYKEYVVESYLENGLAPKKEEPEEKPVFKQKKEYKPAKATALIGCPSISTLGPDHPARAYLEWRKLPPEALDELFWTDNFPVVVDNFLPGHQFSLVKEGRIIIPFYDSKHQLIAMQGRSQPRHCVEEDRWVDAPGAIRYITIKADKDASRIFGMHRINKFNKERIYCVEGPFDSLFLPNCVAMAGSDIPQGFPRDRTAIVYDNERLKPDTIKKIEKAVELGYSVCIWPNTIKEKDINNMVLAGYKPDEIRKVIDTNLFSGARARLELQHWAHPKGHAGKGNGA